MSQPSDVTHSRKGVFCVAGCSLCILVSTTQLGGLGLVWGTQVLYVASYFHHYDQQASTETMYYVFPVAGVFFGLGSSTCSTALPATYAYQRVGARIVICTAVSLLSLTLLWCSFMTDYILFVCVYSVMQGAMCSSIVFASLFPPWLYYPHRKGTVTGITMVAYGGGCALQGLFFTFLMNPNNESPTLEVHTQSSTEKLFDFNIAGNYALTFRWFAGVFAAIGLAGAMLITEPDNSQEHKKTLSEASLVNEERLREVKECPNVKSAVKTWTFWCLMLVNFTGYTYDYFLLVQYKAYAAPYIHNDHLLSTIGAIGQVGNVLGRLVMTVLVDYADNRLLVLVNSTANALLAFSIHWTVTSTWLYTLSVSLSFFFFGFSFSPTAVICGKIFGVK